MGTVSCAFSGGWIAAGDEDVDPGGLGSTRLGFVDGRGGRGGSALVEKCGKMDSDGVRCAREEPEEVD